MGDNKFVDAIYSELFEKNFPQYKNSLTKPVNGDKDSYAPVSYTHLTLPTKRIV